MRIELPYGRRPLTVDLTGRNVQVLRAPVLPPPAPTADLVERALDNPLGAPPLAARPGSRVTLIVSDHTRLEPRETFVRAVRRRLPDVRLTIAIATGTHGSSQLEQLGLSATALSGATLVNHDGHRDDDLVDLGNTSRGTPVRVHRCLVEADLVVATGCIRPHYFAGFGAGVKAIFPGLGHATSIRINHRLKTDPNARAGAVVGNPCRDDLDEAFGLLATPTHLLDGICGPDDQVHDAIAGHAITAFRAGAERARPWFTVRSARAPLVIASDALPITASLYQAAKIAAAAAPLIADGGTLALVAECPDGIGPLDTVNEAIFRIGVLPRLPRGAKLVLISSLSEAQTNTTLLDYAPSVDHVVAHNDGPILVIPNAAKLICEPSS